MRTKCPVKFFSRSKIRLAPRDITRDESQRRFFSQHSVTMLEQCCNCSKQCCNAALPKKSSLRIVSYIITFNKQNNTLHKHHTFLYCYYIAFPSPHDYDVKMPHFTLHGVRKQENTQFSFSFWTLMLFLKTQLPESSPTFDNVSELKLANTEIPCWKSTKYRDTTIMIVHAY